MIWSFLSKASLPIDSLCLIGFFDEDESNKWSLRAPKENEVDKLASRTSSFFEGLLVQEFGVAVNNVELQGKFEEGRMKTDFLQNDAQSRCSLRPQ